MSSRTDNKPSAIALVRTAEARTDAKPRVAEFTRTTEVRRRKNRVCRIKYRIRLAG